MINRLVIVLATVVSLTVACTGDKAPSPTATLPEATTGASPEPTSQPSVTPTDAVASVSPSPRSSPSATPTSEPTGVPTAQPTPTATPRPDGLEFHFGPGVSDFDRSLITRAVEVTGELLSAGADVRPPSAVFADSSPQRLENAFATEGLAQLWRSQGMADRMTHALAEASYRGIVINTGNPAWQAMDGTERLRAVAHEYVHVIQLERAGQDVADETLSGAVTETPPAGPFWLLEGSAEVVSWLVVQELNLGSYPDSLFDYAADVSGSDVRLEDLSSFIGYRDGGGAGLGMAVLATDYLLRSRSVEALFDFWGGTSTDASWSAAFSRYFGMPPEFFYIAFKIYYDDTWAGFRP